MSPQAKTWAISGRGASSTVSSPRACSGTAPTFCCGPSTTCERVSGHGRADFEGRPALSEELVLDEDRPTWRAYQTDALAGREQPSIEYRIRTREGEVRWVEQTNNPVRLDGDRLAGTRGSIRDVTSRKQAELDLKRAYQEIGALKDRLEGYTRESAEAAIKDRGGKSPGSVSAKTMGSS